MLRYIVSRVFYALITLLLLSVIVFLGTRLTGDPARAIAGETASAAELQAARQQFGLDQPLPIQYWVFVSKAVQGDFGKSYTDRVPAINLFLQRAPASLELALVGFVISLIIGLPLGVLSAVKVNGWWDNVGKVFGLGGMALPSFWVGLLLILVFGLWLRWLPVAGKGGWETVIMPAFTLGWYSAASNLRLVRSSMLEVLGSEFIKLARLKGLSETTVVVKHAFKNALVPVMTMSGINLVFMFSSAVVVESVFAWPGVGQLLYQAISTRDYAVVQTIVLMIGVMMVAVNLVVDLAYAYIDPRIRYDK